MTTGEIESAVARYAVLIAFMVGVIAFIIGLILGFGFGYAVAMQ